MMICFLVFLAAPVTHAAALADGTYTMDYVIKKAEDESVSMANDYWEKPATVIVKNGAMTVQVKINNSSWVTEFRVPGGGGYVDAKVISRNEADNTRIAQFSVDDLSQTMLSKIHVTVEQIDYDHDYTIRFDFNTDSLKLVSKAEAAPAASTSTDAEKKADSDEVKAAAPQGASALPTVPAPSPAAEQSAAPSSQPSAAAQAPAASAAPSANKADQQMRTAEPTGEKSVKDSPAKETASAEPADKKELAAAADTAESKSAGQLNAEASEAVANDKAAAAASAEQPGDSDAALETEEVSAKIKAEEVMAADAGIEASGSSSPRWLIPTIVLLIMITAGVSIVLIRRKNIKAS